jgi:hypothetical protein
MFTSSSIDDACFCRYLRARDWDVKKAEKMLRDSIEWRRQFKPHEITKEQIKDLMVLSLSSVVIKMVH